MKNAIFATVATVMISSPVMAQEAVNTVQSGDAATAAYINSLVNAINANSAALAALTNGEAQLVEGKTYDINVHGMTFEADKLGADPTKPIFSDDIVTSESFLSFSGAFNGFSAVRSEHSYGRLKFNSDGTISLALNEQESTMTTDQSSDIGPFADSGTDPTTYPGRPTQADVNAVEAIVTGSTWTQVGPNVTVSLPSDPLDPAPDVLFQVSLSGDSIQSMEPMFLDSAQCVDANGNSDAAFLDPIDFTGDGVADPYCRVQYESEMITGVLVDIPVQ